jgi:hypothetical protein
MLKQKRLYEQRAFIRQGDRIMGAAAAVVGGASLVSGVLGSKAAKKAAGAQEAAARTAASEEARQFDITQEQLAPFREAGLSALEQQQALLGLGGEEEQQAAFAAFGESPGQKFLRDQQERALLRNASAIGGLGGGNVRSALQAQAFGRSQTDIANQFNRLAGLSEAGRSAAVQTGQFGAQSAGNIANLQQAGGAARASGILGRQQAISGGIQNLAGAAGQFGLFGGGGGGGGTLPTIQSQNLGGFVT